MGRGLMLLRIEPSLLSNSPESRQPLIIKKGRFLSDLHFTPTAGPTQSGPVCEPLQGPEQHWESWRRQQMCADKSHTEGNRLRDFIKDLEQLCCTQGRMTLGQITAQLTIYLPKRKAIAAPRNCSPLEINFSAYYCPKRLWNGIFTVQLQLTASLNPTVIINLLTLSNIN